MKKLLNNRLFLIVITVILTSSISVYASLTYNARDIYFTREGRNNINNLEDAINDLYDNSYLKELEPASDLINTCTLNIENNKNDILYLILFTYTSANNGITMVNERTQIDTINGADSKEIVYKYNSNPYAIRIYKLTNCGNNVEIKSKYSFGYANMILLK